MYQMINTVAIPTDVWLVGSHHSKEVLSYGLGDIDLQYLFTWIWDSYGIILFHMCLKVDLRYINQIEVESCIGCMKSRWADDTTTTKQRATIPWGIPSIYIYTYIYMCVCVCVRMKSPYLFLVTAHIYFKRSPYQWIYDYGFPIIQKKFHYVVWVILISGIYLAEVYGSCKYYRITSFNKGRLDVKSTKLKHDIRKSISDFIYTSALLKMACCI